MCDTELTITEVLQDPMIRLMMRADGISLKDMKTLLTNAELAQRNRHAGNGPQAIINGYSDQKHFDRSRRWTCAVQARM